MFWNGRQAAGDAAGTRQAAPGLTGSAEPAMDFEAVLAAACPRG